MVREKMPSSWRMPESRRTGIDKKREWGDPVWVAGFPRPWILSSVLDSGIRQDDDIFINLS